MGGIRDDLQETELPAGQGPAATAAAMKRKADAGNNGDDGDLSIMDHFVRGLIERPDEA